MNPSKTRQNCVAAAAVLFAIFSTERIEASGRKFQVNDAALAAKLSARGAKLIADYGSFQIFDAAGLDENALRNAHGEFRDDYNKVELNAGRIDTTTPEAAALRHDVGNFAGKHLHLIQFIGPPKPEWHDALTKTGVRIVSYIPENSYLVYGDARSLAALQKQARAAAHIQWEAPFIDDYKIHPKARVADKHGNALKLDTDEFAIQLLADAEENPATLKLIDQLKLAPVKRQYEILDYVNVIVRIPPSRLKDIAARPEVISIHPYYEPKKHDERQDIIIAGRFSGNGSALGAPGYLSWLSDKGFSQAQFTASGFAVDVSDSGIDDGSTTPNHFGLYEVGNLNSSSRVIYNRLEGSGNSGSTIVGCDGHGTINAHIIGGYVNQPTNFPHADSAGYLYGLGVCPFVKVGSSVIFDPSDFTFPSYPNLQSRAYNNGARISNNSWGADNRGDYDTDAQTYDALVRDAQRSGSAFPAAGNQEMVIVFSSGNDGRNGAQTVGSPGTAKNVITVGAAENLRSHNTSNGGNNSSGNDGCGESDAEADNFNSIASFSSRGPCADGRMKPEIVAPGTHITGGAPQNSPAPSPVGTGSALPCFDGSGVCALSGNNFFPLSQQFYTTSSGTSHSTPAVAGGCALIRQYFINNGLNAPSPAMTKAFLINSARYMNGSGANDTLWSANQGMGEMNLGFAFDAVPRTLRDQLAADKFTASGQTHSITNKVFDSTKPVRVTLAWTDAPGSTSGNAYKNNLDLTVTVGGNTYKGNVFSGANSIVGGTADTRNNVESVFLPAGISGAIIVTVTAANINSDGVPNEAPSLDQDYALVIYNAGAGPILVGGGAMLTAESCAPANTVVDPNETVTMKFVLKNIGTAATTNLVATLLPDSGIALPSSPQVYGAIPISGASITQAFSFVASSNCGSTITATLQLQDGEASYGTVAFIFTLGQSVTNALQNFDGVATPALPSGWTTAHSGAQVDWVTSSSASDTAPNAAFAAEPGSTGISELISPVIGVPVSSPRLAFRHSYNMEAASSGTTAYDGAVLEIKIGSGSFTDIVAAGGNFISGSYTHTISGSFSNGLAGRQAWSGNSSGFITSIIDLPPSAAGRSVQFKWRCGTDSATSKNGWYVDTIEMQSAACCGQLLQIVSQPENISGNVGIIATFDVVADGSPPLFYQWRFNGTNISGATQSTFTITNAVLADAGNYSVTVSNAGGVAISSDATLAVFGETNKPTVTITSPAEGLRTTAAVLIISGTASDDTQLSRVMWQVNGGETQLASGTDNWSAPVPLSAGLNTFRVFSVDTSGNASLTNSRNFTYVVMEPVTLITNGIGSVTPSLGGALLEIGKQYSLTAKPGINQVFAGWSRDVSSMNPALTFTMQSNLVVQANFLANPFVLRQGNYSGLFYDVGDINHQSSGFFTMKVASSGAFSCKLLSAGLKPSAKGTFTFQGFASVNVNRKGLSPLTLALVLDVSNHTDKVTGTVSDGNWIATLEGDRSIFNAATNPAPQLGKYTLALVHQTDTASIPGGDGIGTVTVDAVGKVALKGTLADGVKASQKTSLSRNAQVPFYVNLYSGQGSTLGWLTFTNRGTSSLEGDVSWIKTGLVPGKNYISGFTNDVVASGSHYPNPVPAGRILNITDGEVILSANNLNPSFTNGIFLNTDNTVSVSSGSNNLKLTLTASSGAVKGTFTHPSNGITTKISGIILPEQNQVRGFFLNTTTSGAVLLQGK